MAATNKYSNIHNATFLIMLCTLLSKGFGFFREIIFSYFYGTSTTSDAYLFSLTFSTVIIGFIGIGFNTGYIPMYNKVKNELGEERANHFTNNLSTIFLLASVIIIAIVITFTRPFIQILANGFSEQTMELAIMFCRIGVIGIASTGLMYIFKGYLQLHNSFVAPTLVGIPLNIVTIVAIFLSKDGNLYYLAFGSLLATFCEFFILIPFIKKNGFKFKFTINFKDKYLISMLKISLPLILSVSTNQISVLIDKALASQFVGGISSLSYSQLVIALIADVVTMSIITTAYPLLTRHLQNYDIKKGIKAISDSIGLMVLILVPCMIGIFICGESIIRVIYQRGAFNNDSVILSANMMKAYAIGIIFVGIRQILIRFFYALQETKIPVVNSVIAILANIIMNFVFINYIGVIGVALSTSLSTIISTVLMARSTKNRAGMVIAEKYIEEYVKMIFAALCMGAVTYLLNTYCCLFNSLAMNLLLTIFLSIVTYAIMLYLLNVKQFKIFVVLLKSKMYNRKGELND